MSIIFRTDIFPDADQIIDVYDSSGINRPTKDKERISKMYKNSNLVVTAWEGDQLVGISRALTDFCYCCYLSDLAVKKEYQHIGIGKKLIELTKEKLGDQVMLLLLAAPAAIDYYPKLGMEKVEVVIKGRGNGRETSVRALKSAGLNILSIEDRTNVAHNGCRPPKKRRL